MKLLTNFLFCAFVIAATAYNSSGQNLNVPAPSPYQHIEQDFALSHITLEYSRPGVKGRKIYGGLVPYGKIWRTGANASTRFTFNHDVFISGKRLTAGTYALYTIPSAGEWTMMFYPDLNLGGSVTAYDRDKELFRFNVKPVALNDLVETFTIQFTNVKPNTIDVEMLWEKTKVVFQIMTDIDKPIMESIDKAMALDSRPYYQAASYYYDNNKDLNKAYDWVQTAINQNPKAFWMWALKTKIELKLNKTADAAKSANQVIQLATEAKNDDYVQIGRDLLSQAK